MTARRFSLPLVVTALISALAILAIPGVASAQITPDENNGLIKGRVTTAGSGVGAVTTVDLFTAGADGSRGQWLRAKTSDASGNYNFAEVTPGCYILTFIAPNGSTFTNGSPWYEAPICVPENETTVVNASLADVVDPGDAGSISGTVIRPGNGVGVGVDVDLFTTVDNYNRADWLASSTTDAAGNYTFENLAPGCYLLTFIAPAGESFATSGTEWYQPLTCLEAGEANSVEAVLATAGGPGAISGTVTGNDNPGVSTTVADLFNANADGSRGLWLDRAVLDSAGNYSFDEMPDGCYVLTFTAPFGRTFPNGTKYFEQGACLEGGGTATISAALS